MKFETRTEKEKEICNRHNKVMLHFACELIYAVKSDSYNDIEDVANAIQLEMMKYQKELSSNKEY